jgi:hypothetical protein
LQECGRPRRYGWRPGRVLDRDVVVDDQRPDGDPVGLGHLLAHLERHPVAGVVVDDVQHALRRGEQLGRLVDVIHRRRGEHVTGAGRVEHALADDHHVRGLVPGTRPLDHRDLVIARGIRTHDEVVLGDVAERIRVRESDALEHLGDEQLGVVDELFHR